MNSVSRACPHINANLWFAGPRNAASLCLQRHQQCETLRTKRRFVLWVTSQLSNRRQPSASKSQSNCRRRDLLFYLWEKKRNLTGRHRKNAHFSEQEIEGNQLKTMFQCFEIPLCLNNNSLWVFMHGMASWKPQWLATMELNINRVEVCNLAVLVQCYVSEEVQIKIVFHFLSQVS